MGSLKTLNGKMQGRKSEKGSRKRETGQRGTKTTRVGSWSSFIIASDRCTVSTTISKLIVLYISGQEVAGQATYLVKG